MDINQLKQWYQLDNRCKQAIELLINNNNPLILTLGLETSARAFFIHAVSQSTKGKHLIVENDKDQAHYLLQDLQSIKPEKDSFILEDMNKNAGDIHSKSAHQTQERMAALNQWYAAENYGVIMVTYPEALYSPIISKQNLQKHGIHCKVGNEIDLDNLLDQLIELGFERVDFVYEPGTFSIRGGIIDIFTFTNEYPYRIELFDNEVESIRSFDTETQLSIKKIHELKVVPTISNLEEEQKQCYTTTLLEEKNVYVWTRNHDWVIERLKYCEEKNNNNTSTKDIYTNANIWEKALLNVPHLNNLPISHRKQTLELLFDIKPQFPFHKKFDLLANHLQEYTNQHFENFIFSNIERQLLRIQNIFEDQNLKVKYHPIGKVISEGFVDNQLKIACFTDHQIFERYQKYQTKIKYNQNQAISLRELKNLSPGDFVTHIDHGVGRFSGLEKLEVNGKVQEMVRLIYQGNDILYVNISSLHKISKYVGKEGNEPKLNKLGSDAWENLKRKTKKQVKDIAADLIKLYAKRKAQKGYSFQKDGTLQNEMEASFIYEDTPDQLKATQDVKRDMEKPHPMDRLVCGDVGFGKTEVAIRAAFKSAIEGKQVAVLVPTTILALQHYKTFKQRLNDFPIQIDYINRFKTQKEKTQTIKNLADGKIDILIGTHSLINEKIQFKDLGLFVIDEEQKFGVAAKEKIKAKKLNVDTLTLTATPIPRTLQFSLMGARDLSIINTPPSNRQPIVTKLCTFNLDIIKEAIYQEVQRGGQVFFIHNRIKDLLELANKIKQVCPDVDLGIAHGQMEGPKLELEMFRFIEKEYDVLLSTSIVEAGLDISNANTIIINNAHQFGMSDLHQMRGRVGRSNKKAYCYLMSPPLRTLSDDSRKRLQTLEQFSDLGSGFNIAMRDMDIRGAGNLLGAEQSGFIADIGYNTYHKILDEAIRELKNTEFKEVFQDELEADTSFVKDCTVETDLELWIPDSYITQTHERMLIYTRINQLKNESEINQISQQLTDRFGKLPKQVLELFDAIRMQWIAKPLGIEKISIKQNKLKAIFITQPDSMFYESKQFQFMLNQLQKMPSLGKLSQQNHILSLHINHIDSLRSAFSVLQQLMLN